MKMNPTMERKIEKQGVVVVWRRGSDILIEYE